MSWLIIIYIFPIKRNIFGYPFSETPKSLHCWFYLIYPIYSHDILIHPMRWGKGCGLGYLNYHFFSSTHGIHGCPPSFRAPSWAATPREPGSAPAAASLGLPWGPKIKVIKDWQKFRLGSFFGKNLDFLATDSVIVFKLTQTYIRRLGCSVLTLRLWGCKENESPVQGTESIALPTLVHLGQRQGFDWQVFTRSRAAKMKCFKSTHAEPQNTGKD